MKKYFILALVMMSYMASHCQPSLGGTKRDVLKIIRDDPQLTFDKETIWPDVPCIIAHTNNAKFIWYFKDDVNDYFQILVKESSLSNYTNYFDANLKKDGKNRWINCLHDPCCYYLLSKLKDTYVICVSWNKID